MTTPPSPILPVLDPHPPPHPHPLTSPPSLPVPIPTPKTIRKPRAELTRAHKLEIARLFSQGATIKFICAKYQCARRTALYIKKQSLQLLKLADTITVAQANVIRNRTPKYPVLEKWLALYVDFARAVKMRVTCTILQTQALVIKGRYIRLIQQTLSDSANAVTEDIQPFHASMGWVMGFLRRNSLSLHVDPGSQPLLATVRDRLRDFNPDFIYNLDQVPLYFRLLPLSYYAIPSNERYRNTLRSTRFMSVKDRLMLIVCSNATGTEKVPLAVVASLKHPRCFHRRPPSIPYFFNPNAWTDAHVVREWFFHIFIPFIRRTTQRRVALILERSQAHDPELKDSRGQITVITIPPRGTVGFQPLDYGIFSALRVNYRHELLRRMVVSLQDREQRREQSKDLRAGTRGIAEGHDPHLLDAIDILVHAWNAVSNPVLAQAWVKSRILPDEVEAQLRAQYGEGDSFEREQMLNSMWKMYDSLAENGCLTGNTVEEGLVKRWACVEDDKEVQEALVNDLMARAMEIYFKSEKEEQREAAEGAIGTGAEVKRVAVEEVESAFGEAEKMVTACGNQVAMECIRKAKEALLKDNGMEEISKDKT